MTVTLYVLLRLSIFMELIYHITLFSVAPNKVIWIDISLPIETINHYK